MAYAEFKVIENQRGFAIVCSDEDKRILVKQFSPLSEDIARQTCELLTSLVADA